VCKKKNPREKNPNAKEANAITKPPKNMPDITNQTTKQDDNNKGDEKIH